MAKHEGTKPLKLLFSALSLLLLSALVVFSYATWVDISETQSEKLLKQNQTIIGQSRDFFNHQTRLLVKTLQPSLLKDKKPSQALENIFDYLLSATDEVAVYTLLTPQGKPILSRGQTQRPSLSSDTASIIDHVRINRTAQIGYLTRPSLLGEPLLPFFIPILGTDKSLLGIVVAFYHVQGEHSLMNNFIAPDGNTIWLLGAEGRVHFSYPVPKGFVSDLFSWRLSPATTFALEQQRINPDEEKGIELEIKGEMVLANTNYLPEYNLITVNSHPLSSLKTLWLERMQPVWIVFTLFLVIALFAYRIALKISHKMTLARQKAEGNVHKLSKAIEQSPNSVVITDNNWNIEYANSHFNLSKATPSSKNKTTGHNISDFPPYTVISSDLDDIAEEIQASGNWFGERKTEYDGKWYSFSISSITNPNGEITHYVTVVQDISSRKESEARLYKQANFDPLTGLPNRRRAHEDLSSELQNAWKEKRKVAVLYLDIDNFKNVNDTFGHMVGDQLLQLVAGRLIKSCRDKAHLCHISGDEFLVYHSYKEVSEVEYLSSKILRDVATPVIIEGKQIFISISIGIARYPDDNNDVTGLVKYADIALYESKRLGRDRATFFDISLEQRLKRKNAIENELRMALENNEVCMHYQSKNDIQSGKIIGFEALMRWKNRSLGPVSPVEFIEIAEEIGIIKDLGAFALQQASEDLKKFQKFSDTPLKMAVNLSVRQLNDDEIIDVVENCLKQTGIDPTYLELEITESLMAENIETLLPRLNKLIAFGCPLTIDDFGTGYSSLSYLNRFPVSTLKVDQAFVKDMVVNKDDATLAQTIIAMSHALGLKVVAEGIEDVDQLAMLQEFGCDIGQGYLFSKPLEFFDMVNLIETENLPGNVAMSDNLLAKPIQTV